MEFAVRTIPAVLFLGLTTAILYMPTISIADELLDRYQAHLSWNDHHNTRGQRLRSVAAIIRQDRANFHRYNKRDIGDTSDRFFSNLENRARLERLLRQGRASDHVRNLILNSDPVIVVDVYGTGTTVRSIEVFLKP